MLTDLVDALDRRYRVVERAAAAGKPDDLLVEAVGFLRFLRSEPRLYAALDDLLREGMSELQELQRRDAELVKVLQATRELLIQSYPEVDDSNRRPPDEDEMDPSYRYSLAVFNEIAGRDLSLRMTLHPDDREDESRSGRLLEILQAKRAAAIREHEHREDSALTAALWNASEFHRRLRREWILFSRSSAAVAAHRVLGCERALLPEPVLRDGSESAVDLANRLLPEMWHPLGELRAQVFDEEQVSNIVRDAGAARWIANTTSRLYEEVRARLGTARSHRALVERFRLRAELYDAAELREISAAPSRPEDALAERLARFLFDAGLNPLIRPLVGTLEPDLLDRTARWTFYVEAKQYHDKHGRGTIVNGMRQVWDTLSRLRDHPRDVREAFYVVFRRGGPRYVLPDELRSEGVRVFPVLVDIAPPEESGSRQRQQPREIPAQDLLPRPTEP